MCTIEMTAKAVAVIAIICGSSVFFCPKVVQRPTTDDRQNRWPQHHHRNSPGHHPVFDDIHGHLRSGAHPGLSAVAEMKRRAASQQGSSSNGAMGVLLPLYAAGIIIFYVYAMNKIFGLEEKSKSRRNEYTDANFPIPDHQLTDEEKFVSNNEDLEKKEIMTQQKDLEKLLLKADREDMSDIEMLELKRQLLKAKTQIAQIQKTIDAVQHKVGDTATSATNKTPDVDNYMEVDHDESEVDLSKAAEDGIEKTTKFDECFDEFFDDSTSSGDGNATDEERNNENTPSKSRDLQNYVQISLIK